MTTGRHRLYRGGHRQATAALHRAVVIRMRYHQPTIDYVIRRRADGRTKPDIIRCRKRFLAREIYQRVMREEYRGLRASWPGGSVGPGVSVFGRVGPPSCHVCHDRWPARTVGWTRPAAHRQAVSGPRLPGVPRALTRWCVARGGGAGRCAGWQGRPRGAAGGLAPPAPAVPDRRPVGPRRRAVPARG